MDKTRRFNYHIHTYIDDHLNIILQFKTYLYAYTLCIIIIIYTWNYELLYANLYTVLCNAAVLYVPRGVVPDPAPIVTSAAVARFVLCGRQYRSARVYPPPRHTSPSSPPSETAEGLTTTVTISGVAWRPVGKALTVDEVLGGHICIGRALIPSSGHSSGDAGSRHSRKFARVRSRRI